MIRRSPVHGVANRGMVMLTVVGLVLLVGAYLALRSTAPNEKGRVRHDAGFSIVPPPAWGVDRTTLAIDANGESTMHLSPVKYVGKSPGLVVAKLPKPPDVAALEAEGFVKETFQGAPAWQRHRESKRVESVEICAERSGVWFRLLLTLPGFEAAREADYLPYLQTLKVEKSGVAAATNPATTSSAVQWSATLPVAP